jgi:hypothetical protein
MSEPAPRPPGDHESFRALFENALVGLGVADLQGNLLAFNDAMLEPGGYTPEDIHELRNVGRLYATEVDRDRVLGVVRAQGYAWREEVQFLRKDGSAYDALLTLTPVRFMGQPCLYATVEDVTEKKRLEGERRELEFQLWRAQKMEAVGQMTAGIAHDFNNLLSIIRGSCDMLALSMDAEAEAAKELLENIRGASRRGATMIQKLLGFSRTAKLDVVPTDLATLVQDMESMLRAVVSARVELELEVRGGSVALCDRGAVEEMVLNLVTNARDAMPDGGTLRLIAEPWTAEPDEESRPSWLPAAAYVRVAVEDTGAGMCGATLARALEPFFTTKAPGAGTGLGLPMVYGLAKQQGGFLDLASEPGVGTTVRLYFPRVVD